MTQLDERLQREEEFYFEKVSTLWGIHEREGRAEIERRQRQQECERERQRREREESKPGPDFEPEWLSVGRTGS